MLTKQPVPGDVMLNWSIILHVSRARWPDRQEADPLSSTELSRESPPAPPSDAELIASAQAGHPEAWAAIYDANYLPVYRYVRARIFEPSVAEDLAADVFLAALKGIRRYRHRGRPLLAWLYGIARHSVAEHQRQLGRAGSLASQRPEGAHLPASLAEPGQMADPAPSGGDPADMIANLDLQVAIQQLTESQREVIILRYFVGLTAGEIATVIGKDTSAIYSLEARAMLTLRKTLGK